MFVKHHHVGLFTAATVALASLTALGIAAAQQGTPSQPPRPSNPTPRPSNPTPRPTTPPAPGNPTPAPGNPTPSPNNPAPTPVNPTPNAPNQPVLPDQPLTPDQVDPRTGAARSLRPFAFQTPMDEARFNESARRLVTLERRFQQSNQDLLRRLGDVRQLSGERQQAALYDLLQTMLRSQADLNDYLVRARTAWTGDIDLDDSVQPLNPQEGRRSTAPTSDGDR